MLAASLGNMFQIPVATTIAWRVMKNETKTYRDGVHVECLYQIYSKHEHMSKYIYALFVPILNMTRTECVGHAPLVIRYKLLQSVPLGPPSATPPGFESADAIHLGSIHA